MGRARRLKHLLLLSLLVLLIYGNTFSFPFQFDDLNNIVINSQIRDFPHLDFSGTRALGLLSFALNYRFGGLSVFGYHLVNLLIHIANGFLVYSLVLLLLRAANCEPRASWIALATALLFVAHPVQTQAVTYIVQRFSSLVALFYLLAVVGYLKWRLAGNSPHPPLNLRGGERGRYLLWYAASLLSCLLAMKTKENSFTLPLTILLAEWTFFKPMRWKAVIPFFLLAVPIILFSQVNVLGEAEGFARETVEIGRLDYLFTQFRVIVTYLRLLVLPVDQTLDYDYPVYRSLFAPPVFASFLFLAALLGLAAKLIRLTGLMRLVAFGIFWFFLTLSVESSVFPIKDVIVEHRLYLPSVGFFLGIGFLAFWGWERWRQNRTVLAALAALAVLVIVVLSIAAHRRSLVWKDNMTLWRDVVEKAPQKPRGHYNLGFAYQEAGLFEEAIVSYRKTVKLKPDYAEAWNNLGASYSHMGRFEEAVNAFRRAFAVKPDNAEARYNLGSLFTAQGRLEEAIPLYRKALELKPDYFEAHNNLGTVYTLQGRIEEAVSEYRKALEINPGYAEAARNLENAAKQPGK